MSTWSSGIGKFLKKDPNHGKWGKKIKHWLCKVGLCNLDKCKCKGIAVATIPLKGLGKTINDRIKRASINK